VVGGRRKKECGCFPLAAVAGYDFGGVVLFTSVGVVVSRFGGGAVAAGDMWYHNATFISVDAHEAMTKQGYQYAIRVANTIILRFVQEPSADLDDATEPK
jgi:hypothetical protein